MISAVSLFLSSIAVALIVTFPVVWALQSLKLGQPIRQEGPATHLVKAGTPTMGGIGIIISIVLLALICINVEFNRCFAFLILLVLAYAAIGLADDFLKVRRGKNEGLTFWQKIILQTAAAALFAMGLALSGLNLATTGARLEIIYANPFLYQLLIIFIVVGAANAANLTDGLNGLLAGTMGIAFLAFSFVALALKNPDAQTFALLASGATLAFLYYNFPRAKVFMGDVGSLALGAALAGLAIILHKEIILILIGGVFVAEALSVIIQVGSYKLFKKRVFRMAPLHHHFEMLGYKEIVVVIGFWVVGLILGIIGVLI